MNNLTFFVNCLGKQRDSQTQPKSKQSRKNPMKMLSIIGFCLSLFTICLSSGAASAASARVNARNGLNVRTGPSTSYGKVYDLSNGQAVSTTGTYSNGWVQLSNGYWVSNGYLNYGGGGTGGGTRTSLLRRISAAGGANIRSGPSTAYSRVNYFRNGTPLTVTGRVNNGWYELTRGRGWIAGYLLTGNNSSGGGTGGGTRTSLLRRISATGGANIRSGPSTAYGRVNYFRNGTPLTVTGRVDNGWYELTRGRGWIAGSLLG